MNISSHASLNLTPLLSVYSASKVIEHRGSQCLYNQAIFSSLQMFVNHFSAALHREYSNTGVTVQANLTLLKNEKFVLYFFLVSGSIFSEDHNDSRLPCNQLEFER